MARTLATLPEGSRITDYVSLGVLTKYFPMSKVRAVLEATGKASERERSLPAHVMVYYVLALALYMGVSCREVLRCLLEGLQWLLDPSQRVVPAGRSGISQARSRLGSEPLRQLHDECVGPVAGPQTQGARYGRWRLVSIDGSTLDLSDTQANDAEFGRPSCGQGAGPYPQLRFVSLVENGTHVLFASQIGAYRASETEMAHRAVEQLKPGMLCLADRNFYGFPLWSKAVASGADLLWRMKKTPFLPCHERLEDGSYLSKVYRSDKHRARDADGIVVRVIEYTLEGVSDAEPSYRLATTILDPETAPASELAALYHERWEIETALDELKTHLRGGRVILRSKTPDLVRQEFYGLMMTHFAVRALMHEAAASAGEDPDRLSYVHAVRVIQRTLPRGVAHFPPEETEEGT